MCVIQKKLEWLNIARLCAVALVFRIGLIGLAIFQDANFGVKFTDVDYKVFTDAARRYTEGGSPFDRATYRYTPLLAVLLTPNIYLHEAFGKVIFCCCDLFVGVLLYRILRMRGMNPCCAVDYTSLWLLNPVIAIVSARGNAESLLAAAVVGVLYAVMVKHVVMAAVLFGFAVHLKTYPIFYALPLYIVLDGDFDGTSPKAGFWAQFRPNVSRVLAILISAATFAALTFSMYQMFGDRYIEESFRYHVVRKDNRHNFSLYFFTLYLTHDWDHPILALLPFVPQLLLTALVGWRFAKDLPLAMFLQTFIFVAYNKVCTSQYFLWYLCILPLILPPTSTSMPISEEIKLFSLWAGSQGLWLFFAYFLEHQAVNTFMPLWVASIIFFIANSYIICQIVKYAKCNPIFRDGQICTS